MAEELPTIPRVAGPMSFASVSAVYQGPHLASIGGFAAWRVAFLSAAGDLRLAKYYTNLNYEDAVLTDLRLAKYYTNPNYEDAVLTDLISPAKTHLLTSRAECAEPEVPSGLSARKWEKHMQRRQARVQERVALALTKEAAHLKCRAVRTARLYLLSALAPPLRSEASALSSPSAIWSWLDTTFRGAPIHATGAGLFRQLQCAMQIKHMRGEDAMEFFERFEIAANEYIVPYLTAAGSASDATQSYADVVGDRFRVALLANALPPHLRDQFEQWQAGFAHWDYTRIKQHVVSQMEAAHHVARAASPPQELVHDGLPVKKEPSCSFCQSTTHSDAACVQPTKASAHATDQVPPRKRRRQVEVPTRIKTEGRERAISIADSSDAHVKRR